MTVVAEIDWAALAEAAYLSVGVGLGVLLVASVAVTASLRGQDAKASGAGGTATAFGALTAVCLLALLTAVVLGIYFMTDK